MRRPTIAQLESRCQKPDHRRVGNWMARRVSRPLALRVTWIVAPWGVSAHAATVAAWLVGLGACVALGWGNTIGWLVGAGLLQLWYLLDHVDGQLARLRGTASLDGVQLDYLMHHTLNLLVPIGLGWGLFVARVAPIWVVVGLACGISLLLNGLTHDTRYKAFVQRLKRVRGRLMVEGGGGGRPAPAPPPPSNPRRLVGYLARKFCEPHVVMNVVSGLAIIQWAAGDSGLAVGCLYLATLTAMASVVAVTTIVREQLGRRAEVEFAVWYRPPSGHALVFDQGWWTVEPEEYRQCAEEGNLV